MPGVGYVSRIEMHHDTDVAHDAYGVRRLVRGPRGCHVTIVVEIDGWEGGRPNVAVGKALLFAFPFPPFQIRCLASWLPALLRLRWIGR